MKRALLALVFSLWSQLAVAGVACTLPFNLQNGTTADATQVMANYNALVTCLTNAAAAGANTDITALLGLTTPIAPSAGGSPIFGGTTSTGSANAQAVATTSPTGFSLTQNYIVAFIAGFTNTGPLTLEVNSQTVASTTVPVCSSGTCPPPFYVQSPSGPIPMVGGEVRVGQLILAQWDGTYFEMISNGPQFGGYGPQTVIASATTTTIGNIGSHNVGISGTTTITSFGALGSTTFPIYRVVFQGAMVITYNNTSCSTTGGCISTPTNANITTVAGDAAEVVYLGNGSGGGGNWAVAKYFPASGASLVNSSALPGALGLLIKNDSSTPSAVMDVTASYAVMLNPTGNVPTIAAAVSVTPNITASGANGLDTGSVASSTWYNVYLISTGSTVAGLYSLSATAPTMPSGYSYFVRVGAVRTDSSSNLLRTRQLGSHAVYVPTPTTNTTILPSMNATTSSGAYTAIAVGNFVPPTATQIKLSVGMNANNSANNSGVVAPNPNYPLSGSGPAAGSICGFAFTSGTTGDIFPYQTCEFTLESTNIYFAGNTNILIADYGWTDAVNAN